MSLRAERSNLKQSSGIGIAFLGTRDNEKSMPLLMWGYQVKPVVIRILQQHVHKDTGRKGNESGREIGETSIRLENHLQSLL
jgi:hypothetical protein